MNLRERLDAARDHANKGGVPMRRTDKALYSLLAECLGICEDVLRDGLLPELRAAVRVRSGEESGKGRRYAETGSDVYILVARSVLEGVDNRNSVYRYSGALRCAGELQIRSNLLEEWLNANGGVVSLYKSRSRPNIERSTKTIALDRAISYKVGVPITITIEAMGAGRFRLR